MIEYESVPGGFRVKDLSGDTAPYTYHPPYTSYLFYYTKYGVWRRTAGSGKWEFDSDKGGRNYRHATIRVCGIPQEIKGRHYDALIVDDMPIAEQEETLIQKNYREMKAKANADRRWNEVLNKKEVKDKMDSTKSLFRVILFNRKTEEIDYKGYTPACGKQDATMQAAQTYGKYDSKVHLTVVWELSDSSYIPIK